MMTRLLLLSALSISTFDFVNADSATWNLNPVDNTWNNAANWTPAIVPHDQATFDVSNVTVIITVNFSVQSIVFNAGASAFTLARGGTFLGTGIVNNSGVVQNLAVRDTGVLTFFGSASAGENVVITNKGGSNTYGAVTEFEESSTAANATFINEGALVSGTSLGPHTNLGDSSNAESATFINNPGAVSGAKGGYTYIALFGGQLGNSTFIANAATAPGAQAGYVQFQGGTCAGASFIANGATIADAQGGQVLTFFGDGYATFTANGGTGSNAQGGLIYLASVPDSAQTVVVANGRTNGGLGGTIQITGHPVLDLPQFELFGNGTLDLTNASGGSVTIGSLSGTGMVLLGTRTLYVETNNFTTSFSGLIQDSGRLVKAGTGKLTLTGANTYTGLTRVSAGVLVVNNRSGSATGTGYIDVDAGTLGGKGVIQGAVAIGTGSGTGAILAPSVATNQLATLTLNTTLTFKGDGTYAYKLNTNNAHADQVIANGVTIESGAQFSFQPVGTRRLPISTVFTPISNTSAGAITGTFANLADGSTFTAGQNNFLVSYSGGDGNDLTFTVVQ